MDTIFIKGIECQSVIGVWEWERHVKQKLRIDVELGTDFSRAAETDALDDAVDYQKVTDTVVAVCDSTQYRLLEALITDIADRLWSEFELQWLKVTLGKGGVLPQAKSVGLSIELGQRS